MMGIASRQPRMLLIALGQPDLGERPRSALARFTRDDTPEEPANHLGRIGSRLHFPCSL